VHDADHFVPVADPVHIATNDSTLYRGANEQWVTAAVFFGALTNGAHVEVEGTYDSNTNTLTATKVKLEGGDD
jgi:hypothetical protein